MNFPEVNFPGRKLPNGDFPRADSIYLTDYTWAIENVSWQQNSVVKKCTMHLNFKILIVLLSVISNFIKKKLAEASNLLGSNRTSFISVKIVSLLKLCIIDTNEPINSENILWCAELWSIRRANDAIKLPAFWWKLSLRKMFVFTCCQSSETF